MKIIMENMVIDLIKNFTNLFDLSDQIVLLVDKNQSLLEINKTGKELLQLNKGDKIDSYLNIDYSKKELSVRTKPELKSKFNAVELDGGNTLFVIKQVDENKKYFEEITSKLPIGIVVFSKNGEVAFFNQAYIDLWGIEKDDLINYNIFEDRQLNSVGLLDKIKEVFEGKPFLFLEGYYDSLLEKGKGYRIWVETTIFPIFNERSEVELVVIAHKDITEVKLAQEEIKIAKDEAEESNRLKNAFLANLSHEIRTPMNAIIGFGGLIAEIVKDKLDQSEYGFLENFNIGIKRLNRTLTQILELSQIDTGNYELKIEPVDLKTEIEKVLNDLKSDIEQKNLEIILNLDEKNKTVLADVPALNRILTNLIENSVKFTQKGYIKIETYPNLNETILFCSIKDTGIGISEEYLDHIFEPFSQEVDGYNRPYEGNGLGLALTKRYLDLINSSITVDSVKGVGSTFTFTLPIYNE